MNDILKEKYNQLKLGEKYLYFRACYIGNISENLFLDNLAAAISNGVDIVELSGQNIPDSQLLELSNKVKLLCAQFDVTFIIKGRTDIAYLTEADGVYLDNNDIDIVSARKILGDNTIIGVDSSYSSVNSADYLIDKTGNLNSVIPSFVDCVDSLEYCRETLAIGINHIAVSDLILDISSSCNAVAELKKIILNS